jgi:threonine/homoserine/homoserine lactone efflux protein
MTRALVFGFLVGLPIAAAPGPMFFLVIRRTLAHGWRSGLVSGFGVATGDAAYAALAAFGVAAITNFLVAERRWISLVGGIALIAIGVRIGLASAGTRMTPQTLASALASSRTGDPTSAPSGSHGPAGPPGEQGRESTQGWREFLSTLALTLSNPPTILSFTAVFAGLGPRVSSGWAAAVALVVGVMLGSALWWVALSAIVSAVRERLTLRVTRAVALISGLALVVFGTLIVASS